VLREEIGLVQHQGQLLRSLASPDSYELFIRYMARFPGGVDDDCGFTKCYMHHMSLARSAFHDMCHSRLNMRYSWTIAEINGRHSRFNIHLRSEISETCVGFIDTIQIPGTFYRSLNRRSL
jgi:hypothetical protein